MKHNRVFFAILILILLFCFASVHISNSKKQNNISIQYCNDFSVYKKLFEPYVGKIKLKNDSCTTEFYLEDHPGVTFNYGIIIYDNLLKKEQRQEAEKLTCYHKVNSIIISSYLYERTKNYMDTYLNKYLINVSIHEGDYQSTSILDLNDIKIIDYLADSYNGRLIIDVLLENASKKDMYFVYEILLSYFGELIENSKSLILHINIGTTNNLDIYMEYEIQNIVRNSKDSLSYIINQ